MTKEEFVSHWMDQIYKYGNYRWKWSGGDRMTNYQARIIFNKMWEEAGTEKGALSPQTQAFLLGFLVLEKRDE